MKGRPLEFLLVVTAAVLLLAAGGRSAPAFDPQVVVGIVSQGAVIAGGVPLSSGNWGTDYITVSHALRVGERYAVIREGFPYVNTAPVTACSSQHHGIDVLILRAVSHRGTPVVEWGDPAELKSGDELLLLPRREIHPEPVSVKFVHLNLSEWTKSLGWSPPWRNVMVGDGISRPGFSGSPWARDGKVLGLHKGRVQPTGQTKWYAVAETATRVRDCLRLLNYEGLVPRE